MMKNKGRILIDSGPAHIGFLNIVLTFFLLLLVSFYFSLNWTLSLIIALIGEGILIKILNKRWFKIVKVFEKGIFVRFPFNFGGVKDVFYYNNEIALIEHFDYISSTPAHCRVKFIDDVVTRFNCIDKEFQKLKEYYESIDVKIRKNKKYTIKI